MEAYFQYFGQMFISFWKNFGMFFYRVIVEPWTYVGSDFQGYNDLLGAYSPNFGGWGWFFYVLILLFIIALCAAILYLLYILIRKYVKFYKKELEKDQLRVQIEKLNYELYKTTQEKNRILGLQVQGLGLKNPEIVTEAEEETVDDGVRFAKLTAVDKKYENYDTHIELIESNTLQLDEICERFRFFAASQLGLYYEIEHIRALFSGMGTSKLIILEGISGTGKTSLPYALGRFFQNNAKICSVQPSWRDRSELLGYYNEFTKKFTESDFLKAIYESTYREDINIVVLDEMNLARIEYYFAEFLSIMEMPNISEWNIELISTPQNNDPKHLADGKLLIPQNVWFIGTANNDDSTFTITDKVYDRAISLFFDDKGIPFDCDFTESLNLPFEYLQKLFNEAQTNYPVADTTLEKFNKLDDFVIENFKLTFGNRILKQMKTFIPIYVATGGTELGGLDYIFATKILKKFEALNIAFLKEELAALVSELNKLFGKNEFALSKKKIENLLKMAG